MKLGKVSDSKGNDVMIQSHCDREYESNFTATTKVGEERN